MDKITPEEITIKASDMEAIRQFDRSLIEAGGSQNGYQTFKNHTVAEFLKIVSRNGVRLSHSKEWHMNRLNPSIDVFTDAVNEIIKERSV